MSDISCIVYPPTLDYHYLVQRPQHLMKNFSLQGISCLFMNMPGIYHRDFRGIEEINPDLHIFYEIDPLLYLRGSRPVVYYSATAQVEKVGRFNPSLLVFDSVDEPSDEFAAWKPYYYRAIATADVVLCTSEKLYTMARAINSHAYLVPNGCDYEHFSPAARGECIRPYDLKNIEGPVIGYIGVIATWCDLELIDKLARAYPDYSLVMVGPLYNVGRVPSRPNLHWLGFKAYDQLPAYCQAFDVGIVPFRQTNMTESVNPIKMWEYMAAGLPVVTTALPEARKYSNVVYYSESYASFIENVGQAIENDSQQLQAQRLALARENSWAARAREIIRIMEYHLEEKDPGYRLNSFRPQIMPFRENLAIPGGEYRGNMLITSSRQPQKKPNLAASGSQRQNRLPGHRINSLQGRRYLIDHPDNRGPLVAVPDKLPTLQDVGGSAELRFQKSGVYIGSRSRVPKEAELWMLE